MMTRMKNSTGRDMVESGAALGARVDQQPGVRDHSVRSRAMNFIAKYAKLAIAAAFAAGLAHFFGVL